MEMSGVGVFLGVMGGGWGVEGGVERVWWTRDLWKWVMCVSASEMESDRGGGE